MKIIIEDPELQEGVTMRTLRPHNGIGVFLVSSEGWFGTPAPREEPVERYGTDSDLFPASLTQGARYVTFHGHGRFASSIDAADFIDLVNGLFGRELVIVEQGPNGERSAGAFLSDDPAFEFHENATVLDFDLILTCPDPLKYGDPVTVDLVNGNNSIMVDGNAPTWPAILIVQAGSFTATLAGQEVKWTGPLSGAYMSFENMRPTAGTIEKDNAFQLRPGRANVVNVQCNGTAKMTYMPAWR